MKNKKKILIGLLIGAILFVIWRLYFSELFLRWRKGEVWSPEVENDDPEPDPANYQLGCSNSNFFLCSGLSMNTPLTNVGCCGDAVGTFQDQLILLGQPITKDGMYGTLTKDAHQNALTEMGGTWGVEPEVDDVIDNTPQSGVDSQGNMWYIDGESGAVIYV